MSDKREQLMFLAWFPWKFLIGRMARFHGFMDPTILLARINRFAQPSEVAAPLELVRAGVIFHARGLVNTKAIQQNLDWIWPYWVRRQFDPKDISFLPRAFSITHVNLTHRNWTGLGLPGNGELPIVDPTGLVTPLYDGWSLDVWIVSEDHRHDLYPSYCKDVRQSLEMPEGETGQEVVTHSAEGPHQLETRVAVIAREGMPVCRLQIRAESAAQAWLVVTLRPYNPEGISFAHTVKASEDRREWVLEDARVRFSEPMERCIFSTYAAGDVHQDLLKRAESSKVECEVGMATAAALFGIPGERRLTVEVPMESPPATGTRQAPGTWPEALEEAARLKVPDAQFQFLYDAAIRSLLIHCGHEVYPGPYTYKRFWFRDAAFILHSMLCVGMIGRVERVLDSFPSRQHRSGFFHSQDGEWDSNGEALWIMNRWRLLAGVPPKESWRKAILHGGEWITRKRGKWKRGDANQPLHAGLLPAGFSAEHLGNNDFYYWDDFWAVAGYRAAAEMAEALGEREAAARFYAGADDLMQAIEQSLQRSAHLRDRPGLPASPYRRMDAGAVGSVVASYPLEVLPPEDPRVLDTVEFLLSECSHDLAFFQQMIHSGINAYLTLHLTQVLLRAGDPRWEQLWRSTADLASPTGQWPEAIHPHTKGGCMGDGHHVWASAEWVMMTRNAFVREEGDRLILCSGVRRGWLEQEETIRFGPAFTPWGSIGISVIPRQEQVRVEWKAAWRDRPPIIEVRLPGCEAATVADGTSTGVSVRRTAPKRQIQESSA